jgi:hypothetical protein
VSRWQKKAALVAGVLVLVGAPGFSMLAHADKADAPRSPTMDDVGQLTGVDLVTKLDLQRVPVDANGVYGACDGGIVELTADAGYCIPLSLAPTPKDQWLIALQVRGRVPTDAELGVYDARQDYINAADSGASDQELAKLKEAYDAAVSAAGGPEG